MQNDENKEGYLTSNYLSMLSKSCDENVDRRNAGKNWGQIP